MKFKIIYILCATMLFVAVTKLPPEYYTLLRIAVLASAVLAIYEEILKNFSGWVVLFVIIAITFNPIMPVYLYNKGLWMPIDIACGIAFLLFAFQNAVLKKKTTKAEVPAKESKSYSRDKIY